MQKQVDALTPRLRVVASADAREDREDREDSVVAELTMAQALDRIRAELGIADCPKPRQVVDRVCVALSLRLEPDDTLRVWAPFGLEDLFALRLRPNPLRIKGAGGWARTTGSAKARWPEVVIEG